MWSCGVSVGCESLVESRRNIIGVITASLVVPVSLGDAVIATDATERIT